MSHESVSKLTGEEEAKIEKNEQEKIDEGKGSINVKVNCLLLTILKVLTNYTYINSNWV